MTEEQRTRVRKLRAEGNGYGTIARETGISVNTVKSFCRRSIRAEEAKDAPAFTGEVTRCENCGAEIRQVAKRKRKRFCCDRCRNEWWNSHKELVDRKKVYGYRCPHCGKAFSVYGDGRRKYCSHECYIADRFGGGKDE